MWLWCILLCLCISHQSCELSQATESVPCWAGSPNSHGYQLTSFQSDAMLHCVGWWNAPWFQSDSTPNDFVLKIMIRCFEGFVKSQLFFWFVLLLCSSLWTIHSDQSSSSSRGMLWQSDWLSCVGDWQPWNPPTLKSAYNWLTYCCCFRVSVFLVEVSSVQSCDQMGRWGNMKDDSAEILFQYVLQELLWAVLAWAGMSILRCCPPFLLPTTVLPTIQPRCPEGRMLRGCHGMWHARTMQISIFWQLQKRFLLTHMEVDLAPHPDIGLVLQVGDMGKCPQALDFESLDPFLESASWVYVSQP